MPDVPIPKLSDSRRLAQVIGILGKHGLNGLSASLGIGRSSGDVTPPRPDAVVSALREIGPVAVKFGQVLAMRSDMLPPEWTTALATLQDRVPAVSFAKVRHSLEAALGAPVSDCFEYLDEMPLAAGSIAQVHAAVRKDGAPVIIKIRRPGIEEIVDADLRLLRRLARLAQRVNPAIARQRPDELLRFFAESLDREMDLSAEGNASDEIGAFLAGFGVEAARFDWDVTGRSINVQ
jgi:ubiquinone biosynthesis protein